MRRLQIAQLVVLLLMGAAGAAAAVTLAHVVAGVETRSTRASSALYELGEARDGLRSVESDLWRLRAPGRPVPVTLDAIREVAEARDRLTAVLETQRAALGTGSATIVAGERAVRRLDAAVGAWSAATSREQVRVEAELRAGRSRMVTMALWVVALFGLGGVAVWMLLDRAGTAPVASWSAPARRALTAAGLGMMSAMRRPRRASTPPPRCR